MEEKKSFISITGERMKKEGIDLVEDISGQLTGYKFKWKQRKK